MTESELRIVVGCVADNTAKYIEQALRLLQSWRWFGGRHAQAEFYVCVVDGVTTEAKEKFERYSASVVDVQRFSARHPPSNKLRFLQFASTVDADRVILLDCDTIIVQEPRGLLCRADFGGKTADFQTVTADVFRELFDAFDATLPEPSQSCTVSGEPTIPYFNAGVLSFSRKAMKSLVPEWIRINTLLVERLNLLGNCQNFCEQASLSLALAITGTGFEIFDNALNFPAHCHDLSSESDFGTTDPTIIHYHWLVDADGYILRSPYKRVDERIQQFNNRLRQERAFEFDNRQFWDTRYSGNPTLGSGLGSRGSIATYKRALLQGIVSEYAPKSIIDIGCGDMAVGDALPEEGYVGIDISQIVTAQNVLRYPNRTFHCGDATGIQLAPADMVVCLDLLIHLSSRQDYAALVAKCVELAKTNGVISGFEDIPKCGSEIVFFHEPLSLTLANAGAENVREIGGYRQVRVFQFNKWNTILDARSSRVQKALPRPMFLVGAMRSGTTMLADLLGQSPHVAHCPFELKDIWSSVAGIPMASPKTRDMTCPECGLQNGAPEIGKALTDAFLQRMILMPDKAKDAVFLNKNPHLCNKLPMVRSVFGDARFIWIYRDLPQVVASMKRLFADVCARQSTWHWWPLPSTQVRNRCWNTVFLQESCAQLPLERVFPGGDVLYLAEYWLETNRAVLDFFSSIGLWEKCEVSEDLLLKSPDLELSRIQGSMRIPFFLEGCDRKHLDQSRNSEWGSLLTPNEIDCLIAFVEARGEEINSIFGRSDLKQRYLTALIQEREKYRVLDGSIKGRVL